MLDEKPEDGAHRLHYGLQYQPPDGLEDWPGCFANVTQNPTQAFEKDTKGIEDCHDGTPDGESYKGEGLCALHDTEYARNEVDDATNETLLGLISLCQPKGLLLSGSQALTP